MINNETKESKLNQWKKLFYGCSSERYRINKILFCLKRRCFLWNRWNTLPKIGNFYIAFHIGSFWLNAAHCGSFWHVAVRCGSLWLNMSCSLLGLIVAHCGSLLISLAHIGSSWLVQNLQWIFIYPYSNKNY